MSNRKFNEFFLSLNADPVYLEANAVIDSGQTTGTRSQKGSGVSSIAKVATGVYKISLQNRYCRYLGGDTGFVSPTTGGTIAVTAISPGTMYLIASVGTTTNWQTAGVPAGVTPAVGMAFLCAATSTGNGLAIAVGKSGIFTVEVIGDPNTSITNYTDPHFFISTLDATGTLAAPTDGSVIGLTIYLRRSSVTGKGE